MWIPKKEVNLVLADLHVHTQASDGTCTPEEVCSKAVAAGLGAIAITDHDTVAGFLSLQLPIPGLEVIPGVELSTTWNKMEVHILGYFVSLDNSPLKEQLEVFRNERRSRMIKMIEKVNNLGYQVTVDEVQSFSQGQSIGRPHLARALVAQGYFEDETEVFEELLAADAPAYVPREKLSPQEGIKLILSSGGVPVLAHPGLYTEVMEIIEQLVNAGLKGVEVYYPAHSEDFKKILLQITNAYGLLATGGSDFHGGGADGLGIDGVDMETVKAIKEAAELLQRNHS